MIRPIVIGGMSSSRGYAATAIEGGADADDEDDEDYEPSFFENPKRLAQSGADHPRPDPRHLRAPAEDRRRPERQRAASRDAKFIWVVVAFAFAVVMFAAYVALFRGVVGERVKLRWKDSYDITMAGLAATRLFSAGGAGGIVLTYWALRKAGMPRKETAARMVAFLVLLYAVYMVTLVINGILMSTGVFTGPAPPGMTIVPAAIAGGRDRGLPAHGPGPGRPRAPLLGGLAGDALGPDAAPPGDGSRDRRDRDPRGDSVRARAVARRARPARRDRLLGGPDRDPLGLVQGLRRLGAARGRRPGVLRRHVRQPDPAPRRRGRGRRRDDRRLRALRRPTTSSPRSCSTG